MLRVILFISNSDKMKLFLTQLVRKTVFLTVAVTLFFLVLLLVPSNPHIKNSLLFAQSHKDSILINSEGNRIIFIGGSNVSFGINSALIEEKYDMTPVNLGLHYGLGMEYYLMHCLSFVNTNDIVVVIPEYENYYGNFMHGKEELLIIKTEAERCKSIDQLSFDQMKNLIPLVPSVFIKKLNIFTYLIDSDPNDVYGVFSFNNFGDAYRHWGNDSEHIPLLKLDNKNALNSKSFSLIENFTLLYKAKGAKLFCAFPPLNKGNYSLNTTALSNIYSSLENYDINLIGRPIDYCYADSLFYDSPYHLNYTGALIRTENLMSDIFAENYRP